MDPHRGLLKKRQLLIRGLPGPNGKVPHIPYLANTNNPNPNNSWSRPCDPYSTWSRNRRRDRRLRPTSPRRSLRMLWLIRGRKWRRRRLISCLGSWGWISWRVLISRSLLGPYLPGDLFRPFLCFNFQL